MPAMAQVRCDSRLSSLISLCFVTTVALAACDPFYVLRAGYEHSRIMRAREPIEDLLTDEAVPEEVRRQLGLVLEAQGYAGRVLGLDAGKSYTTFVQLESDTLAFVLTAARKERFEHRTWWFPIVGRVPYKGFFSERSAQRKAARFEARGFDSQVRNVAAFSTLGWFDDPLYSTLLTLDDVMLVNTVIHELVHNTIYLRGQGAFNESFANFVGARGALDFFCLRDPADRRCDDAALAWEDELIFGGYLMDLVGELEALYASGLPKDEILQDREVVFDRARKQFREEVRPRLRVSTFASFAKAPMNNATLISRQIYYDRLDRFDAVYHLHERDLPAVIRRIIEAAQAEPNPWNALETLAGHSN